MHVGGTPTWVDVERVCHIFKIKKKHRILLLYPLLKSRQQIIYQINFLRGRKKLTPKLFTLLRQFRKFNLQTVVVFLPVKY